MPKMMSKARYNRLRAEALTPAAQQRNREFMAAYAQRPDVIEGRKVMLMADRRRKERLVRAVATRFVAEHPVLAKRYGIVADATWAALASALYTCYAEASGKGVWPSPGSTHMIGHGTTVSITDPHKIQGAWMAADWLAKQEVK